MQKTLARIAAAPPAPPQDQGEAVARLRLIRSRKVGPATYMRLLAEYGSAQSALDALPEIARAAGVEGYAPCPEGVALAEWRAGRKAGARAVFLGEDAYPAPLAAIADAPPMLWLRGDGALLNRPMIAIVGTRNASSLGGRMARQLAQDLGQAGFCIVSGLARGIDALAHEAALPTGTIAVCAGGVDVLYPPENRALGAEIAARGLALSEQPMGLDPQARHFPRRNRIISGLSCAVIVVEAAEGSGTMITARSAADQGREVMAVPGHPLDQRAALCNRLLREGAVLVRHAQDVIDALPQVADRPAAPVTTPAPIAAPAAQDGPSDLGARLLAKLSSGPVAEDCLIRDLDLPARQIAAALCALELSGAATRLAGGLWQSGDALPQARPQNRALPPNSPDPTQSV